MREDQQIEAVKRLRTVDTAEGLVREHLEALEASVDNRIYSTLGKALDPTEAVRLVTEKATIQRMWKKFKMDRVAAKDIDHA